MINEETTRSAIRRPDAQWQNNPLAEIKDDKFAGSRYDTNKSTQDSLNTGKFYGYDVGGPINSKEIKIRADISGCQFHIQNTKKAVSELIAAMEKLNNLRNKSLEMNWKTLNKEAYEMLIENEIKYFEASAKLFEKMNQYINLTFNTIMDKDKELQKYLQ